MTAALAMPAATHGGRRAGAGAPSRASLVARNTALVDRNTALQLERRVLLDEVARLGLSLIAVAAALELVQRTGQTGSVAVLEDRVRSWGEACLRKGRS